MVITTTPFPEKVFARSEGGGGILGGPKTRNQKDGGDRKKFQKKIPVIHIFGVKERLQGMVISIPKNKKGRVPRKGNIRGGGQCKESVLFYRTGSHKMDG